MPVRDPVAPELLDQALLVPVAAPEHSGGSSPAQIDVRLLYAPLHRSEVCLDVHDDPVAVLTEHSDVVSQHAQFVFDVLQVGDTVLS